MRKEQPEDILEILPRVLKNGKPLVLVLDVITDSDEIPPPIER